MRMLAYNGSIPGATLKVREGSEIVVDIEPVPDPRTWVAEHLHGTGTTEDFIALSERISGRDRSDFFRVWRYTVGKPTSW